MKYCYLLFLLGILSCSKKNDPGKTETPAIPFPQGFPVAAAVTKTIGPAGGDIAISGEIKVTIPPGAVSADTEFKITPVSSTLPLGSGNCFRLEPENIEFNKAVEVSIPYTDEDTDGSAAEMLYLAYQDKDGYWTGLLGSTLDKTNKQVKVNTWHFSDWGLFRRFIVIVEPAPVEPREKAKVMLQIEDHRKARYRNEKEEAAAPVVLVQPHQYKSTENITGWKVLGTGKLDVSPEKYYADYTAPDKVTEETREYVEISLKNVVNSQHPDRAGTSGQVITRTRIPLKVEDFNLYVNGAKMDVQYAYATVGAGFIRIQGMQDPNHTFELSISAGSKGTYGYGMAGESGKAIIYNSFVSGRPSRITTKQDCNTNQYIFSGGSVTISELDVAGGIAAGSFTATTWWPDVSNPSVCQYHEQKLSGDFRITIL